MDGKQQDIKALQLEINSLQDALEKENEELRKAKEQAEVSESMLRTLVSTAVGEIGQDFFDNIVIKLSEWLGAECVLIGRIENSERVYASPMYYDGQLSYNFSYELAFSPCEMTSKKGYCAYPQDVINLFPRDHLLVEMSAEGYIGTALYNKQGVPTGVICAVSRKKIDVPPYAQMLLKIIGDRVTAELERKKTEEALLRSEARLMESNATKDKFLSLIAHDLKSPFNALLGLSEMLTLNYESYNNEKRVKFINHIYHSAKTANSLIDNLLQWANNQQGKIIFSPSHLNLSSAINESLAPVKNAANEKGVTIETQLDDMIYANADLNMLLTILRNLISNAIKFSHPNGIIKIIAKPNITKGRVIVSIKDNGVGIESARLNDFFRIDRENSTLGTLHEKGTGLGLILCKDFVEKHGGTISIDSTPGNGSCFSFDLELV